MPKIKTAISIDKNMKIIKEINKAYLEPDENEKLLITKVKSKMKLLLEPRDIKWTSGKREELRNWGESFAKTKGIKEEDIQKTIHKKRYGE